jgi:O-6-methylguanine DNA methyltransferase
MNFSEVKKSFLLTELGWLALVYTPFGLREVQLVDRPTEASPLPRYLTEVADLFQLYTRGEKVDFSHLKLDFSTATPFKARVYEVVRRIPYGEVRSYSWVAKELGEPLGVRAVGQALSHNKLLIVVPCHRVIRADGSLGGWSGKPGYKEKLLKLEKTNLVLTSNI